MIYSDISIIYNPNSTGDGAKNAKELMAGLAKELPGVSVRLLKTEYAGHGQELALKAAASSKRPLIISSSGDGGYNEVINGAMAAQKKGAKPICAVLASGNANDHSRTLLQKPLLELIAKGKPRQIDLLKITITHGAKKTERYAHSYIGLGLTPVVAVELNKTNLNALKELWIVLHTFYKYRPFKISHNNKRLKLDSIIFANIGEMAKVLTISKDSKPDDGLFETIAFPHKHKFSLIRKLVVAAADGLKAPRQYKSYTFRVLKTMPAQLDGEVIQITKGSNVTINSEYRALTTLV